MRQALFTAGIIALILAFADADSSVTFTRWLAWFSVWTATAAACFYALHRISKKNRNKK